MSLPQPESATRQYSSMDRAPHLLHKCTGPEEFCQEFEAATGRSIVQLVDEVVASTAPKAVFVVGSLALGMGASGSDVDLIVLIDGKDALVRREGHIANNAQQLEFSSESSSPLAGVFLSTNQGVLVDMNVAITPEIHNIYARLRRRGPELNETEIRTLGRLNTGWLLWQTDGYLERNSAILKDPTLAVYCCTKDYVNALHEIAKAARAIDCQDMILALQLGRISVELAYLAYFSSEGLVYLGTKWLAQLGHARGAQERISRHPLVKEGIHLLFPPYTTEPGEVLKYLRAVSGFLTSIRQLIEQKTLFRIAFSACPQVHAL